MIAKFWKVLRRAWLVPSSILTAIGLLYAWPDIRDLPATYGYSWEFLMLFDREHLAYVLLGFAFVWILWIEIRPLVKGWWKKRRRSSAFTVLESIHCETGVINTKSKGRAVVFYENIFYVAVGNNLETGKTLTNVQARIYNYFGPPTVCQIKDSASSKVNIRHGEWFFFEVGKLVSNEITGPVHDSREVNQESLREYLHNIPNESLSFKVRTGGDVDEYGLAHSPEMPAVWNLLMVVSADDVKSENIHISIDMTKTRAPVSCELAA